MPNLPCARFRLRRNFSFHIIAVVFCLASVAAAEIVYPKNFRELAPIADMVAVPGHVFILHPAQLAETSDGGVTWTTTKTPLEPKSIYFLDPQHGWLVGSEGLYETSDAGKKWRRIIKSHDLLRCWFLSAEHGWAIGNRKTALETQDGGKSWQPLEAAAGVVSDVDRTSFTWIEFSGRTGFISGFHSPKRPAQDATGRQWPQMGVLIQTNDGGQTWKPTSSAVFGRLSQARVGGRTAALVLQFDYQFEWPSEVYRIDLPTGETTREYREMSHRVCAALALPRAVAVASVKEGKERTEFARPLQLNVGGEKVALDEKMTASSCYLASDGANLWLASDSGLVEKLASN
jgi:hypothetical protein